MTEADLLAALLAGNTMKELTPEEEAKLPPVSQKTVDDLQAQIEADLEEHFPTKKA